MKQADTCASPQAGRRNWQRPRRWSASNIDLFYYCVSRLASQRWESPGSGSAVENARKWERVYFCWSTLFRPSKLSPTLFLSQTSPSSVREAGWLCSRSNGTSSYRHGVVKSRQDTALRWNEPVQVEATLALVMTVSPSLVHQAFVYSQANVSSAHVWGNRRSKQYT